MRLRSTAIKSSGSGSSAIITRYRYDPLNRVTSQTTGTSTASYSYLGMTGQVSSQTDPGHITKTYGYTLDGTRLFQATAGNPVPSLDGTAYYSYNNHGDVEALTGPAGTPAASYGYTAYGSPVTSMFTGADATNATPGEIPPPRRSGCRRARAVDSAANASADHHRAAGAARVRRAAFPDPADRPARDAHRLPGRRHRPDPGAALAAAIARHDSAGVTRPTRHEFVRALVDHSWAYPAAPRPAARPHVVLMIAALAAAVAVATGVVLQLVRPIPMPKPPAPPPAPAAPFTALTGWDCTGGGGAYGFDAQGRTGASSTIASGGWPRNGCDGTFEAIPLPGKKASQNQNAVWWFKPTPGDDRVHHHGLPARA